VDKKADARFLLTYLASMTSTLRAAIANATADKAAAQAALAAFDVKVAKAKALDDAVVKDPDSRSQTYIGQYGTRCWETDILPGATIEAALNAHIQSWLDTAKWNRRDAEIERASALL
jgi:hypothetical protein